MHPIHEAGEAVSANTKAQIAALKRAAARTLTRAAGMAQDDFMAEEKRFFRASVDFTTSTKGFGFKPARPSAQEIKATFYVRPRQAAHLQYPIEGGREPGAAGTSEHYVWKPTKASSKTAAGGLIRYYTKQLASEEKEKRPVRGGGIYFGNVAGHKDVGFVLRPGRTLPLYVKGKDGKMRLARPHDRKLQVRNVNPPVMLAQAAEQSAHRPILPFESVMRGAMGKATGELGKRLVEELGRR